jgi:hypothetical protein
MATKASLAQRKVNGDGLKGLVSLQFFQVFSTIFFNKLPNRALVYLVLVTIM